MSDIVEHLRREASKQDMLACEDMLRAADEIERLTEALRKIYRTHPLVIEAAAEIERLRQERDEWKAKWISLMQASLIAGTMTLEQKADE